jgi:hypothetical protein
MFFFFLSNGNFIYRGADFVVWWTWLVQDVVGALWHNRKLVGLGQSSESSANHFIDFWFKFKSNLSFYHLRSK